MTVKTYSVPNISCHHCVNTIERELKDVADASRLAAVEATLDEIGYPVEA